MRLKFGQANIQPLSELLIMRVYLRSKVLVLLATWLAIGASAWAQTPAPTTFRLAKLEFEELQKISKEKAVELSGLSLGQSLKLEDLNPVIDKLFASGQFAQIRYRYGWTGDQLEVIFQVEEAKLTATVSVPIPQTAKPVVLGKIEFKGLQRCDLATSIKASGLKTATPFEQKQLNEAAKRLINTGFFAEINYSFLLITY
jgi:outer membrane protein assembly factor BamA